MKLRFFMIAILIHILFFICFSFFHFQNNIAIKNINININKTSSNIKIKTNIINSEKKFNKNLTSNIFEKREKKRPIKYISKSVKKVNKSKNQTKVIPNKSYKRERKKTDKNSSKIKTNLSKIESVGRYFDKNLVKIKNGKYVLKNQNISGIKIVIKKHVDPIYPDFALKMGYEKTAIVKVRFLVNIDGEVEDIKFYTNLKYGFENSVKTALKQWLFKPIMYKNRLIPMYFYKNFRFVYKN